MKKYIYLVLLSFTLFVTGCSKSYLEINDNPNSPTESSITPDLILPLALHRTAAQTGAGYATQAQWMGYWTRGGDFGPSVEPETYQITTNFSNGLWANWYDILTDYNVMETKARVSGQKMYEAIGKTMKVVGFMNLVDVFNNVPYSKAFDIGGNILPAYDKGPDIYKDFFVKLDEAMVLLNASVPGQDIKIGSADVMFAGDVTKWKKLVNTIRLKLVLRLSETTLINHTAELAKVSADGFLMAGETAEVQPGYKKEIFNNISRQSPFWDSYEADPGGVQFDKFNRANNYTLNALRSNSDIRYTRYFDQADAPLGGNIYFGYDYGVPQNAIGSNSSSRVSGPGLAKSFDQPQWFMTSVESLFLQAEAAQRGWITPAGGIQGAYNAAVTESFVWLGVPNAATAAATYLSSSALAAWPPAPGIDQLRRIMTQKYFSLVGINNFEAWTDYRRLNTRAGVGPYPNVPLSLAPNREANIPVRYRYPQTEYNFNPANVAAENDPNPITSPIFWDVN